MRWYCILSLYISRLKGKRVISFLSSEVFRDLVLFDVGADEFLIGGGVGAVLGLASIIELSKLDFGIFDDFSGILIVGFN